jgi:hypothetical protein
MKAPAQRTRAHVVRAHVSGGGGQALADAAAHDHQVPPHDAGRSQADGLLFGIAAEIGGEIYPAALSKGCDRRARVGVERVDIVVDGGEHAPFTA